MFIWNRVLARLSFNPLGLAIGEVVDVLPVNVDGRHPQLGHQVRRPVN